MLKPTPYKGKEPYIFISYAHRNNEQVYPIIETLSEKGFRVWYDDAIVPGSEWDSYIAGKLEDCTYVIAIISKEYLESDNCKDELNYARDLNKPRLLIYLSEVALPSGMQMRLGRLQALYKYSYDNESRFYEKLFESEGLEVCLGEAPEKEAPSSSDGTDPKASDKASDSGNITERLKEAAEVAPSEGMTEAAEEAAEDASAEGTDGDESEEKPKKESLFKKLIPRTKKQKCIAGAIIAAIMIIIALSFFIASEEVRHSEFNLLNLELQEDGNFTPPDPADIALSDDILDFTFELDGFVYKLPCYLNDFLYNGWTFTTGTYNPDSLLESAERVTFALVKDGKKISVTVENFNLNQTKLPSCVVTKVNCDVSLYDAKIILPKNISIGSTEDDLLSAHGIPCELDLLTKKANYRYSVNSSFIVETLKAYVEISCTDGVADSITIENRILPERYEIDTSQPTTVSPYLLDFTFDLEGKVYKLPCSYSALTSNGWTSSTTGYSSDTPVSGYGSRIFEMINNGSIVEVTVHNPSGELVTINDCVVVGVKVRKSYNTDIKLSGGITLGHSCAEVKSAYGPATYCTTTSSLTNDYDVYRKYNSLNNCVRFDYKFGEGCTTIEIINDFVNDVLNTQTSHQEPLINTRYVAPSVLGQDILSGNISLERDLYTLPAPVSEFIENGWKILAAPRAVGSNNGRQILMEKDDEQIYAVVGNYSEYQLAPEACMVYRLLTTSDSTPSFILPAAPVSILSYAKLSNLKSQLTAMGFTGRTNVDGDYQMTYSNDVTVQLYFDGTTELLKGFDYSIGGWS